MASQDFHPSYDNQFHFDRTGTPCPLWSFGRNWKSVEVWGSQNEDHGNHPSNGVQLPLPDYCGGWWHLGLETYVQYSAKMSQTKHSDSNQQWWLISSSRTGIVPPSTQPTSSIRVCLTDNRLHDALPLQYDRAPHHPPHYTLWGIQLHRSWPGLAGGHGGHSNHLDHQKQKDVGQDKRNIFEMKYNIWIPAWSILVQSWSESGRKKYFSKSTCIAVVIVYYIYFY